MGRSAALRAQEEERARVARDLHDEVNQSLTGRCCCGSKRPARRRHPTRGRALRDQGARQPGDARAPLARPPAAADGARRPRPAAAIAGQVEQSAAGRRASLTAEGDFSDLDDDVQLVVYGSPRRRSTTPPGTASDSRIEVSLRRAGGGVELEVADDGRGFAFDESERGLGISGMRERALLIGAELTIESRPGQGTTCAPGPGQLMPIGS